MFRNRAYPHDWDGLLRASRDGLVFPAVSIDVFRHGESELNALGRFTGSTDSPLTEHGRRQAAAAGKLLAPTYDIAMWSGLQRSRETLHIARSAAQIAIDFVVEDARIREHSYGVLEGKVRFPIAMSLDDAPAWGAEPYRQVAQRCLSVLLDIAEVAHARNRNLAVLMSTHAGPCRILRGIKDDAHDAATVLNWKPGNGEVIRLNFSEYRVPPFLL